MAILVPLSSVQMIASGFITSMSWPVSICLARTSPGPCPLRRMRFGPSPCMRRPIPFTLRTISVISSSTPGSEENSCSTPSICSEVIAAPCSEESSTRLSALPSVRPKPRSNGSATTTATREVSSPGSTESCFGLMRACQFFCSTSGTSCRSGATAIVAASNPGRDQRRPRIRGGAPGAGALDPAPLGRPATIMRDRGDVADGRHREAHRLQRAGVGVGALAAARQAFAVPQAAIAAEIHQLLDVHRHLAPQIAIDGVVAVDQLADAQHLVVGQLVDAPLRRNRHRRADLLRRGAADTVDVGEPDRDPLLTRDVDASYTRHLRLSCGCRAMPKAAVGRRPAL